MFSEPGGIKLKEGPIDVERSPLFEDEKTQEAYDRFLERYTGEGNFSDKYIRVSGLESFFENRPEKKEEIERELGEIDEKAFLLLIFTSIWGGCSEEVENMLIEKKGGAVEMLKSLKTITEAHFLDKDDGRQSYMGGILGNPPVQDVLKNEILSSVIAEASDTEKSLLYKEGQKSSGFDEDNFLFFMIQTVERLAQGDLEAKKEAEAILFSLVEQLNKEIQYGVAGEIYDDKMLEGNRQYAGLRFDGGMQYDNVLSHRIKQSINAIGRIGSLNKEAVTELLDFFETTSMYFAPDIASACSKIGAGLAMEGLFEKRRNILERKTNGEIEEGKAVYLLENIDALWHRVEFGKMNIDNGVIDYFEKRFILSGVEKDNAAFARRISFNGQMGIFDSAGVLSGYIELGSLGGEKEKQAELLEITREMLFSSIDTPDEIRQQFLSGYTKFYEETFGEIGGMHLSDLTLKEQVWMYQFWQGADEKDWEEVIKIKEQYGLSGVKVFQALEMTSIKGETILSLFKETEELPDAGSRIMDAFARYADSIDADAEHIYDTVSEVLGDDMSLQYIKRALLGRATGLLSDIEKQLKETESVEEKRNITTAVVTETERLVVTRRETMEELLGVFQDIPEEGNSRFQLFQDKVRKAVETIIYRPNFREIGNLFQDIGREEYSDTEKVSSEKPLYLPVGISRDLPQWREVFEGKKKAMKPIDVYGYLFWLENQGKAVELVVADTVQVSNYTQLYGLDEDSARTAALEIGDAEIAQYQQIIDTFGLLNITVKHYDEVKGGGVLEESETEQERFDYYYTICSQLADHPMWKQGFLGAAQSTSAEGVGAAYSIDEVAFILAKNEKKVSHEKESRYDVIATVIQNLEVQLKKGGFTLVDLLSLPIDVRGADISEQHKYIANIVSETIGDVRDFINNKKTEAKKSQQFARLAYFDLFAQSLKTIKEPRMPRVKMSRAEKKQKAREKKESGEQISFDIVIPDVGAKSFGWAVHPKAGVREIMKFREQYSTYFFGSDDPVFLGADQVVASKEGVIGGKLLAFNPVAQEIYAKNVLVPMCKEFFHVLQSAPESYFSSVGKSREELVELLHEVKSMKDILDFLQKYMVVNL
ncbi:MAG: hypothetical protein HOE80_01760 [Candidatus Magasanikbacteria bacterium]|jgi:hypothetical protein|nr:hypothetical protein [Candidatus Magasanikbacteria bacterium]MBT4071428.1 hypothetical protein [Candidatus Magasanikbacteria bacterium]